MAFWTERKKLISMQKDKVSTSVPRQKRAIATYEKLLSATGKLLAVEKFEKITTNLVAERADVSPPALYRYFKDKYDLIGALGRRWTDTKDQLILDIGVQIKNNPEYILTAPMLKDLLAEMVDITEEFTGGVALMQCLRTVPQLKHIVHESHDEMARSITEAAVSAYPDIDGDEIYRQVRLSMDIGYSAMEFVICNPFVDRDQALQYASKAIAAFSDLVQD